MRGFVSPGVILCVAALSACSGGGESPAAGSGGGGAAGSALTGGAPGSGGAETGTGGAASGGVGETDAGAAGASSPDGAAGAPDAGGPGASRLLDLLLVVDNSISMADKQAVLAKTVPDLVQKLTDTALGLENLHVGVISSSLGGFGPNTTCVSSAIPLVTEELDDHARLVGTRPRAEDAGVPSGFATWTRPESTAALVSKVQRLVQVTGEFGCGFEATLEAMYRFAADPAPPATVEQRPCSSGTTQTCAFPTGVDDAVLGQRLEFFRPDSNVAIVVLSDENDCSIRPTGQFFYATRQDVTLPKASAVCATNPNDPCCHSCAAAPPAGCPADDTCAGSLTPPGGDRLNLRCFEEKRRFGLDMLYPVSRYVNALHERVLCTSRADLDASLGCPDADQDGKPDLADNPLFAAPTQPGQRARDPSMVYFLGIVGVPWQSILTKKDANGDPYPGTELHYPDGAGLAARGLWDVILGDPAASPPVPPADPLMIESTAPRTGTTPGTGEALAPVTAGYLANSVNGHEWGNTVGDDLEYTCIFPLEAPRDCNALARLIPAPGCDCSNPNPGDDNPLCQTAAGTYGTTQSFAKGYPGIRHLAVARGLGENGAVASICARNLTDAARPDFGYRPAVDVLVGALARSLK